jgi:hypothetical protein
VITKVVNDNICKKLEIFSVQGPQFRDHLETVYMSSGDGNDSLGDDEEVDQTDPLSDDIDLVAGGDHSYHGYQPNPLPTSPTSTSPPLIGFSKSINWY